MSSSAAENVLAACSRGQLGLSDASLLPFQRKEKHCPDYRTKRFRLLVPTRPIGAAYVHGVSPGCGGGPSLPIGRSVDLIERVGERRYTASAYYQDVERPFAERTYRNTVAVRDNTLFAGVGVFAPKGFRGPTRSETGALETLTRHFEKTILPSDARDDAFGPRRFETP